MCTSKRVNKTYCAFFAVSSKALLQRPLAGVQVPFCPLEKKVSDSWSHIEPSSFKVRGANYLRSENSLLNFFASILTLNYSYPFIYEVA